MIIDVDKGDGIPAYAWEIFYSDGSVYNSIVNAWSDIPLDGVLILIIWHDYHIPGVRKKTISAGEDYYLFESSEIWGSTNDYAAVEDKAFKRGVWTTDEKMEEIYRFAFEKEDL